MFKKILILLALLVSFGLIVSIPSWIWNILPSTQGTGFQWLDIFFFIWFMAFIWVFLKVDN
jgi:hypothetical protein